MLVRRELCWWETHTDLTETRIWTDRGFCCLLYLNETRQVDQTTRILGIYVLSCEGLAMATHTRAHRVLREFLNLLSQRRQQIQ